MIFGAINIKMGKKQISFERIGDYIIRENSVPFRIATSTSIVLCVYKIRYSKES